MAHARIIPLLSILGVLLPAHTLRAEPSPHGALVPFVPALARTTLAFRLLARQEAQKADMPYDLVDAVMKIESSYRPEMIGGVGEIGLMQVRPATAAMMGYAGTSAGLADPAVNIHYGTTYLGRAWHLAHGDVCRTLMKYRAGHGEETMSALSATYCAHAKAHLESINSPLALLIKPGDLIGASSVPTRSIMSDARTDGTIAHRRLPRGGAGFWRVFEARIAVATAKVHAKWRRMASR